MDSINTVNAIFRKYGERYREENPFLSVNETGGLNIMKIVLKKG